MVKIITYCDERDCLEKTVLEIDSIKQLNWRCKEHEDKEKKDSQ